MSNLTPIRVTGTFSPSGTQDVNIVGQSITLAISAVSLPLPTGAATEATLAALNAKVVVVDTSAVTISTPLPAGTNLIGHVITDLGSVSAVTQGTSPWVVSGTVVVTPSGIQDVNIVSTITLPVTGPLTDTQLRATPVPVSGTVAATQSGTWNINNISGTVSLPTGAATEATLATRLADATFTSRINTLGQKTMANSTPVVIASDQSAIPVTGTLTPGTSATAVVTRVATANTSHQLIAANASRKGLIFYNDSTSQQFIKFGITASQTDFTVRLSTQDYYEVPTPVYSGRVDVLGTNSNGAIQVTELT